VTSVTGNCDCGHHHQPCGDLLLATPVRAYQFDTNFLTPNLLPPLTPMLRAINTIGFTQILLPTR
jgi:hypothetical protein